MGHNIINYRYTIDNRSMKVVFEFEVPKNKTEYSIDYGISNN